MFVLTLRQEAAGAPEEEQPDGAGGGAGAGAGAAGAVGGAGGGVFFAPNDYTQALA
jgi:hypothetical protein